MIPEIKRLSVTCYDIRVLVVTPHISFVFPLVILLYSFIESLEVYPFQPIERARKGECI